MASSVSFKVSDCAKNEKDGASGKNSEDFNQALFQKHFSQKSSKQKELINIRFFN